MNNRDLLCQLEDGQSILGFRLEESRHVKELGCVLWVLTHERSGGRIAFFDSGDQERCFSLSFPAFPQDDTGVFHIIEHSIINGSTKYPVRDWSSQGPLSSFFSAFTSIDNTMYPVACKSEAGFQQLVAIYTDCVFSPLFLEQDAIFSSEGSHYEYDSVADNLSCNGIVYNEIKAGHDLPAHLLALITTRAAFPRSHYAYDIGGSPESVPQLTFERFSETYRRFFRPENCLACIWGDTSLYEVLTTLAPYFDQPPKPPVAMPPVQPALWNGIPLRVEYPVQGSEKNRAALGFNWAFGPERLGVVTAEVAARLLKGPISRRLAEEGLNGQMTLTCLSETVYPLLTLTLHGANEEELDRVRSTILSAIRDTALGRPDASALEAALIETEFALGDGPGLVPNGIQAALTATGAFVHHRPLYGGFLYKDAIASIREGGWPVISAFVQRVLLDNDRHTEFVLAPSATLAQRRRDAEQLRLRATRHRLDEEGLSRIVAAQRRLEAYNSTPDNPEAVAALPKTLIGDLGPDAPDKTLQEWEGKNGRILHLDGTAPTVGMTLYFPVDVFDDDSLRHLGVLGLLFGKVGASGHSPEETDVRTRACTGGVSAKPCYYSPGGHDHLFMEVTLHALPDHFVEAQYHLKELLRHSCYNHRDAVRSALTEYINAASAAPPVPAGRVKGYFSHGGAAAQQYGGLGLAAFVGELLTDFDTAFPLIESKVTALAERIFDLSSMSVGVDCSREVWPAIREEIIFSSTLELGPPCTTPLLPPRELFSTAGNMQFSAAGARIHAVTGAMLAVCEAGGRLLTRRVRNEGGAYIVRMTLSPENDLILLTGRDPNLRSTLEAFASVLGEVATMNDDELAQAVLPATSAFGAESKAGIGGFARRREYDQAARSYWNGFHGQRRQQLWEQLLGATPDQIREGAAVLAKAMEPRYYCAFASAQRQEEDGDLFDIRPTL